MIPLERLNRAFHSANPAGALRDLAGELAAEGHGKAEIYEAFGRFLVHLREQPAAQARDEETLLDVMDALSGWCHPAAQLPDARSQGR